MIGKYIAEKALRTGTIPVIMGPTASGKSALALEIAERYNGEIVSADSMQFYRGLDVGTAKPTKEEQSRVRHHLIDTMDISEKSDIYRFCKDAEQAIRDIRARRRMPVIAGGSGLYLHALIYGLDPLPAQQSLRDELDRKYDNEEGFPELLAIMADKCPTDHERFQYHRRKLIRAYEVFLLSGRQMSDLQNVRNVPVPGKDFLSFSLTRPREVMWERIRERTGIMLRSGWIEETEALMKRGLAETPTAWQALGYPLIADYLAGRIPNRDELTERIVIATRQFARRQATWFRNKHPEAEIVPLS